MDCFDVPFKVVATVSAGLAAGSVFYLCFIDGPAKLKHAPSASAEMFHSTNPQTSKTIQWLDGTTIVSTTGAYICTRNRSASAIGWLLIGSGYFFTTLFSRNLIQPVDDALMSSNKCNDLGDAWIRNKLLEWNQYHGFRTGFYLGAFPIIAYLLASTR